MTEDTIVCLNCGTTLNRSDRFCHRCGQQNLGPEARHLSTLLRSSLKEVTSLDGKVWPSFLRLLFRPGTLTRAHIEGRRHQFLKPISVFLMANLLFFLAPPLSDFNIVLYDQYSIQPYSGLISPVIDNAIAAADTTFQTVATDYNQRVVDIAKMMVIFHVPFIALYTFVLGFNREYLYADHVVAALHYFSFLMVFQALYPTLFSWVTALVPEVNRGLIWDGIGVIRYLYVPFMIHFAFRLPWYRTLVIAAAYMPVLLGVHFIYRFVQFWIVFGLVWP
ncbi:MAG: DUF3667 domain-containing protein [Pseudomonadota bacterium]